MTRERQERITSREDGTEWDKETHGHTRTAAAAGLVFDGERVIIKCRGHNMSHLQWYR